MTEFANDLTQSLGEALAHVRGDGPALVHPPVAPCKVREQPGLAQARMAPVMGISLLGYRE